jgi:hypothetical protein
VLGSLVLALPLPFKKRVKMFELLKQVIDLVDALQLITLMAFDSIEGFN